ncbi:MAG: S46 family peptidase [Bacteroidota bacterium]|nr:S46 family peptidase [Bacteroidota bacterium]
MHRIHQITFAFIFLLIAVIFSSHKNNEGMFPLSQLNKVDFKTAGFNINQSDLFNPEGISLTDALVRLGGCTGSFVSDQGLIVTNHHCVFGSVAGVSTKEKDYLENGFYAKNKEEEIKIGLTCRITKSYEDVSEKVLDGVSPRMSPAQKKEIIAKNITILTKSEREKHPELTIEISEMFVGYSYTLFRYQTLKDVRLVYVPPRTIGEFGGESDNWEWPKHTGDFSFVRAYVGKDGKPAEYSADNVPFVPKKHLTVNPKGTKENDLVFILGYPGTTYRHQPYQFIQYHQQYVLPFISEWFGWRINKMEELGKTDRDRYLKMASTIKSLANTKKNFEGKVFGLGETNLLGTKKQEQLDIQQKLVDNNQSSRFMTIIDSLYQLRLSSAQKDLLLSRFNNDCGTFTAAILIANMQKKYPKAPKKSDTEFWNNWKAELNKNLKQQYRVLDADLDQAVLAELISRTRKLGNYKNKGIKKIRKPEKWTAKAFKKSYLKNPTLLYKMIDSLPWEVYQNNEKLIQLAAHLSPDLQEVSQRQEEQSNLINEQLPLLLEAKVKYANKAFVPDANSTLRFTYGYISAYKEGLNKHPQPYTYRNEIFDKNKTDNVDYRLSTPVRELLKKEITDQDLLDPDKNDVVVCMLYNMDTTGGNSGSPVMDKNGHLIGVNFDRAYTATLNDYSWNADYSRSIAVDIRYVLYTLKYLNNAENLIKEMGVELK